VLQQHVDAFAQGLRRRQVADPDGAAGDFVLVGRADAAAGGADLALAMGGGLAQAVERAMERQDERGVLGDQQCPPW